MIKYGAMILYNNYGLDVLSDYISLYWNYMFGIGRKRYSIFI